MRKVDFIVIGSMKAGSTSLVDYLVKHPEVCFSRRKEPGYFSREENFQRGIGWYESMFSGCERGQILGEGSTCYSRWPKYEMVPERLYEYNPRLKLVYIVRQPADRAYSHYRHSMLKNEFFYRTFMEALQSEKEIIETSKYMTQMARYIPYFSREQMFFMKFEDVVNQNILVFEQLQEFLGLKLLNLNGDKAVVSNPAGANEIRSDAVRVFRTLRRLPLISGFINYCITPGLREKALNSLVSNYERSFLGRQRRKKLLDAIPSMTDEEYQYVMASCVEDMKGFSDFSGLDLKGWQA